MSSYLLLADFSDSHLGVSDEIIETLIETASSMCDSYCQRKFSLAEETRIYDVASPTIIDDILDSDNAVVSGSNDGETWEELAVSVDYDWSPYNGVPKEQVALYTAYSRIKVEAEFGFSETSPASIQTAVRLIVGRIAKQIVDGGNIKQERIGDYQVVYAVKDGGQEGLESTERLLLDPYKKGRL